MCNHDCFNCIYSDCIVDDMVDDIGFDYELDMYAVRSTNITPQKVAQQKYRQSEKGKRAVYKYNHSESAKLVRERYLNTDKSKQRLKRFESSEKRKSYRRKWQRMKRLKEKEAMLCQN